MEDEKKIDPNDIIFEDSGDEDMPAPETNDYEKEYREKNGGANDNMQMQMSSLFTFLFNDCVGKMAYNSIIENQVGNKIKLTDLMGFVNNAQNNILKVNDMNTILSFVASCPSNYVKPLMDLVEKNQQVLWTLIKQ